MDINKFLQLACSSGDVKKIDKALELGADINSVVDGYPMLSCAVLYYRLDSIKYLCEKGIKLDIRSKDGYTALDYAEMYFEDAIKLLRGYGAHFGWEIA